MEQYFNQIVGSINIDDMTILALLHDNEAIVAFKAMRNVNIYKSSNMSEAIYRKTVSKLLAIKFIEADTSNKEHAYYITEYGANALKITLEKI